MKWLFVDYFDTLVVRNCTPDNIKRIWAKEIAIQSNGYLNAVEIYKIRIAAEQKVGEKLEGVISTSYDYKQLTREIYGRLLVRYPNIKCFCNDFVMFYKISFEAEIKVETVHQSVDNKIVKKIESAKEQGQKVAIVSDFHMGREAYEIFLESLGIRNLIDEIFVSADLNKRKDSGELYQFILDKLQLDASQCEMVGDNRYSDYIIPKGLGIQAIHYKDNIKNQNHVSIEKQLIDIYKCNKTKIAVNYGFALYAFISRLYEELIKNDLTEVFFLAREGEFLKILFDNYVNKNSHKKIESHYLYVSRVATFIPTLDDLEKETFENLFRQYKDLSPRSFMKSVGLEKNDIETVCANICYDEQNVIENFENSECFAKIKQNEIFIRKYNEVRRIQKLAFSKYLSPYLNNDRKEIAIVDVGWKGTIQDNIFRFLNGEYKVYGYYIGLTDNLKVDEKNIKMGLNFSSFPYRTDYYDIWGYDKSFYEKLLSASHPATIGYRETAHGAEPILDSEDIQESHVVLKKVHEDIITLFNEVDEVFERNGSTYDEMRLCFTKLHLMTVCNVSFANIRFQNMLIEDHTQNFGEFSWSQRQLGGKVVSIIKNNLKTVMKKVIKEGLSIKYMYPAIKALQKMHMIVFVPIYTKLVLSQEMRKLNKGYRK